MESRAVGEERESITNSVRRSSWQGGESIIKSVRPFEIFSSFFFFIFFSFCCQDYNGLSWRNI